ncbi:PEP-CTERM sorting domain-containing protein, partial [Myxococcota bacterium]|nr:PEP-CTERM sorting domain-containing protein [Myxococcota bacterium]
EPGCDDHGEIGNVYEAELEQEGTTPNMHGHAESPGFFSIPTGGESALPYGSLLPGDADHSIDFVLAPSSLASGTSILYWDGSGSSVNWGGVANGESFDIEGNSATGGILSGSSVLSGVQLDSTSAAGLFDTHPEYHLEGNGTSDPTDGFYVIFGVTNIEGLTSSDPWAVVFGYGLEDEEAHELAVDSIASVVPEPGTAILMGLGLVGLAATGRRGRAE